MASNKVYGTETSAITKIIIESLKKIKELRPIVHHITNYVTMNDCANITLAIGASPIMAIAKEEVEEVVAFSSSLVLNIGTFTQDTMEPMILAGKMANQLNIPVILDPVGVGATQFRNDTVKTLLSNIQFSIIKGNMSEIKTMAGIKITSKGVDNSTDDHCVIEILSKLALKLNCTVCATGEVDYITDGKTTYSCKNGHSNLSEITGAGCMTASLIGAFVGVCNNNIAAALGGIMSMSIAGQQAQAALSLNQGIGSFKVNLFDRIYHLNSEIINKEVLINEL